MKREPAKNSTSDLPKNNWDLENGAQNDPLWDILGEASNVEPTAFFARNVVREARLLEAPTPSWGARIARFFSPAKLAVGAAACACALVAFQMWPSTDSVVQPPIANSPDSVPSNALTELVIEDSLDAAAEDPTIFTRDEVVAMIGF